MRRIRTPPVSDYKERCVRQADLDDLQVKVENVLAAVAALEGLADLVEAGTATPLQQRQALVMACRGVVKVARLQLRLLART